MQRGHTDCTHFFNSVSCVGAWLSRPQRLTPQAFLSAHSTYKTCFPGSIRATEGSDSATVHRYERYSLPCTWRPKATTKLTSCITLADFPSPPLQKKKVGPSLYECAFPLFRRSKTWQIFMKLRIDVTIPNTTAVPYNKWTTEAGNRLHGFCPSTLQRAGSPVHTTSTRFRVFPAVQLIHPSF
jgi:hypothetical protein